MSTRRDTLASHSKHYAQSAVSCLCLVPLTHRIALLVDHSGHIASVLVGVTAGTCAARQAHGHW